MAKQRFTRPSVSIPPAIAVKWSESVLNEGFVPFPKRLLRCLPKVIRNLRDLQVVLAVVDFSREHLLRPPSYDFLAFTAGMSVEKFKSRVKAMCESGLMRATGPDDGVTITLKGLLRKIEEETDDADKMGDA